MKYYAIVYPGLEEVALEEIGGKKGDSMIEFSSSVKKFQSVRRVLQALGRFKEKIKINKFTAPGKKYHFEFEHVKGQENREKLAFELGAAVEKACDSKLETDFKNPDFIIVVHFNGSEYIVGIDLYGELFRRDYRVFAHSASFTGDIAYYIVRKSGFKVGEKLLVGFAKDGAIPIEAALFGGSEVWAFDPSIRNFTAMRKNVQIAKVGVIVNKYSLEDLDVKFSEGEFDRVIFHLTSKDEKNINEIYYQSKYVLKSGGTLLLITRSGFDLSVPDSFKLISCSELVRGESVLKLWLLERV